MSTAQLVALVDLSFASLKETLVRQTAELDLVYCAHHKTTKRLNDELEDTQFRLQQAKRLHDFLQNEAKQEMAFRGQENLFGEELQ